MNNAFTFGAIKSIAQNYRLDALKTVVTVAVVTVLIVTYFSKNNLTPQKQMRCSQGSFSRFSQTVQTLQTVQTVESVQMCLYLLESHDCDALLAFQDSAGAQDLYFRDPIPNILLGNSHFRPFLIEITALKYQYIDESIKQSQIRG